MIPDPARNRPRRDDLSSPSDAPLTERETRYRTLFGAMDEGFCVVEMVFDAADRPVDYHFLEFNDAFERMTGITAEAALAGRSARELVPTLEEFWFETYGRVALTGEPIRFENGAAAMGRWFEVHAFRIGGAGSREVGILFRDVTDRVRADAARRESEGRARAASAILEGIIEGTGEVMVAVGPDLRFIATNEAFRATIRALFGREPQVGDDLRDVLSDVPEDRARAEALWRRALAGEDVLVSEAFGDETHARRVFDLRFYPIRNAAGEIVGAAETARDVTARALHDAERESLLAETQASEARARAFFDQAAVGIAHLDLQGRFLRANGAYERIVGRNGAELRSLTVADLNHPEDNPRNAGELARLVETGESFTTVKRYLRPDGDVRWVENTVSRVEESEGRAFIQAVCLDVTDRRRLERALADEREKLESVLALSPTFVTILQGDELRFEYANPAYLRLVGGRPTVGLTLAESQPEVVEGGALGQAFDRLLRETMRSGQPRHFTRQPVRYQPTPDAPLDDRVLDFTYQPLRDAAGTVTGIFAQGIDVTEQARAERALRELNDALEARVEERTAELQRTVQEAEGFNYSISHDLRSPLRAMVSTASILLEELGPELDEEHRALLVRQADNARRMGVLIDELLRLSRLARVPVHRQPLDMTAKARAVADEIRGMGEDNGCAVEVQEGMTATGDPGLVRTVLHNLLGNACKFSPRGGTVRVGQEGAAFSVRDEGVGFDMRYAPKVFLPFERLVTEREFPGTGIGLANVKRIVERHGGRVWVESAPGRGATFSFTLNA